MANAAAAREMVDEESGELGPFLAAILSSVGTRPWTVCELAERCQDSRQASPLRDALPEGLDPDERGFNGRLGNRLRCVKGRRIPWPHDPEFEMVLDVGERDPRANARTYQVRLLAPGGTEVDPAEILGRCRGNGQTADAAESAPL